MIFEKELSFDDSKKKGIDVRAWTELNHSIRKRNKLRILLISIITVLLLTYFMMDIAKASEPDLVRTGYVSVKIVRGDTVTSIANTYIEKYNMTISTKDMVNIISELNNINKDCIHSGNYILVPIYE